MPRARSHVCQVANCGLDFINAKDLQAHNRKQHGTELLSCSKCPKRFTDQSNLSRHLRGVCGQVGDELWYCPFCHNSRSNRRDNVVRHISTCTQRGGREVVAPPKTPAGAIALLPVQAAQRPAALVVAAPAQVHNFEFAPPAVQVEQPAIAPAADLLPQQQQLLVEDHLEGVWAGLWSIRATGILSAGYPGPAWGTNPAFDDQVMAIWTTGVDAANAVWHQTGRYDQYVSEADAWIRPIDGEIEGERVLLIRQAALYQFYSSERSMGHL